jgi:hypothetical protein
VTVNPGSTLVVVEAPLGSPVMVAVMVVTVPAVAAAVSVVTGVTGWPAAIVSGAIVTSAGEATKLTVSADRALPAAPPFEWVR